MTTADRSSSWLTICDPHRYGLGAWRGGLPIAVRQIHRTSRADERGGAARSMIIWKPGGEPTPEIRPELGAVLGRIFHISRRLQPILQPCPLWPFPFLERLVDAVLSRKIKHPRLAQPKPVFERFKNQINRVPIRQQLAKFLVSHGHIVDCFEDSVKDNKNTAQAEQMKEGAMRVL
jgi:hypothetical protein